ncbi:MAG: HigA family addiction module antidote protein [Muribaculaceae bacterium]|nr:HigA family addiction module antidote protein [Muribaculaceae bacterium]MDE7080027.1 HigA family addiction module antidote protein [Muribaculaceae bacterium]
MATNANPIIPITATHPGVVLKKELKARGIKQKDFAAAIGMPAPNLSDLIKGKRNITEAIAIKLQDALGIPFQNWMNLQNRYFYVTKRQAQLDTAGLEALTEEQSLGSRLNLHALYRYFDISSPKSEIRLQTLKEMLDIDLNRLQALEVNTVGYFSRNESRTFDEVNMRTWLLLAWSEAARSEITQVYCPDNCDTAAAQVAEIANSSHPACDRIREVLCNNGITYLQLPAFDGAPVNACSMMVEGKPAIAVADRHHDRERLVFDVLHELGHIKLHFTSGKSYISIGDDRKSTSKEDIEADEFANNALISPEKWARIISARPTSLMPDIVVSTIAREAEKNGISAIVAVSRYKHETYCSNIRGYRAAKISG